MENTQTTADVQAECRWSDPVWLAWWLESHYLLSMEDQVAVALRIGMAVHSPDAHRVLAEYIQQRESFVQAEQSNVGFHRVSQSSSHADGIPQMGDASMATSEHEVSESEDMKMVFIKALKEHKLPIIVLVAVLLFYVGKGLVNFLDWIF
jgi:hypothetical protein